MTGDTTDRTFSDACIQTTEGTSRSPSPEQKQETGTVSYIFENIVECIHFV